MARGEQVNNINRRLIIVSAVLLLVCSAGFIVPFIMKGRMLIPVICLVFGVLGGFMSLEQRLGRLPAEAHDLLSGSWFQVVLRPLYGGIFALVAYILLLSGLVTSAIFPVFVYPPPRNRHHTALFHALSYGYRSREWTGFCETSVLEFCSGILRTAYPANRSRRGMRYCY